MPAKNFLKPRQKKQLQQALRESNCPHFRERVLMLLLMNDGRTYQEITDFLGCAYRTVAYWCVHGDPDNLDTLKDKREKGNYRKVTDDYIKVLIEVARKNPKEWGYECERWSGDRLATHMAELTGIKISGTQVRKLLKQNKAH